MINYPQFCDYNQTSFVARNPIFTGKGIYKEIYKDIYSREEITKRLYKTFNPNIQ